ncbi:LLM class flavin-dependent oxidoreductase [Rhodobacterales bacterium HKCCE2091]|nr:LLM class flavin-dependent oxidoreductase [Rhodobacterales bacterium HKCCE2091]
MYEVKAVFCGNGTLLIQCAEAFREAGGTIAGVVTSDGQIADWAERSGLPHLGTPEAPVLGDLAFDYLFSVANLTVLPADLVARPRIMAINFHDGPLPAMSGLNVPAWAILEGRPDHGVTWHRMVEAVDAGGALARAGFHVRDTDTAFSLNARCYEAGLDAFREMLPVLIAGTPSPVPLEGQRGWYARAKRPDGFGVIDPAAGAATAERLVRALDFGGYANPLALPKLAAPSGMVVVGGAEHVAGAGAPGSVLAADGDAVTIAFGDGAVRFTGLSDLSGTRVDAAAAGLRPGAALAPVPTGGPAPKDVGAAEDRWTAALTGATPALPPFALSHDADTAEITAPLTASVDPDTLAAAWAAWVAELTGSDRVALAIHRGDPGHPALSPLVPVALARGGTVTELAVAVAGARAVPAPMAADLPLRLPTPEDRRVAAEILRVVAAADGSVPLGTANLMVSPGLLRARRGRIGEAALSRIARAFDAFLADCTADPSAAVSALPLAPEGALAETAWSGTLPETGASIHAVIAGQAATAPDAPALEAGPVSLSRAELDARATALAGALAARGAGPGTVVGLCLNRNADLVVAMLAILKTGAAYLPLDPDYPADRIGYMIADSAAPLVVSTPDIAGRHGIDPATLVVPDATGPAPAPADGDLAYLIYTSGSTGRPKGVMVPHHAVLNFFAGMDERLPFSDQARLLAVTSVSFDISVLEILWTLARGATLCLQTDGAGEGKSPDFSLFYFASEAAGTGHHAYRLLLEGAKFADDNGFAAIWTPERHFHAFGGLYPNPAISSAAVASLTKHIQIRAGSCVLPLHHPVRVAEDWALVDNLSNGRAGVALASGWQPNDFLIRPDAFQNRKEIMLDAVEDLRALWRGEKRSFPGHDGNPVEVEIHPRPVNGQIPLWLTAAGNPETFAAAARLGCGVLTHLLGQTFDEVADKIRAYRVAWREAGHPGDGHVVLMLHTFVSDDEDFVRETARGPMKGYLKSAVDLVRRAAWTFPTIVQRADASGMSPQEMFEKEELSKEDLDQLLDHAFERYYRESGLFGTPETAKEIVKKVAAIGADEVGCLIDFGIDTDVVLENLPHIARLKEALEAEGGVHRKASVAEEIVGRGITHLQCTPSMASFLTADAPGRAALSKLEALMVGGEAMPRDLAGDLRGAMTGRLFNMYGPTETTIWSSVAELSDLGPGPVPIGEPITGTVLSIRTADGRVLPEGAEGELWIGGAGVTDGYWQRPDLTADRFVTIGGTRHYRTGDLARMQDGAIDFLGRMDGQVKIRGHRIETGEIEAALADQAAVRSAVVRAVEVGPGDTRLAGYVTPTDPRAKPDPADLRAALAERLPEIMLPSAIVVLDRFPMTPNGKIDRKALPDAFGQDFSDAETETEDATEARIAEIWGEALGLKAVPLTANFFDLGGHSLLVVQVQRRLKEALGRDIAITDMFRFPTVRSLADHLGAGQGDGPAAPTAADRGAARAAARLKRMGRR